MNAELLCNLLTIWQKENSIKIFPQTFPTTLLDVPLVCLHITKILIIPYNSSYNNAFYTPLSRISYESIGKNWKLLCVSVYARDIKYIFIQFPFRTSFYFYFFIFQQKTEKKRIHNENYVVYVLYDEFKVKENIDSTSRVRVDCMERKRDLISR